MSLVIVLLFLLMTLSSFNTLTLSFHLCLRTRLIFSSLELDPETKLFQYLACVLALLFLVYCLHKTE